MWKNKCTDICIFLRLLDQQVLPAHFCAEVEWESKKDKEIEKVHIYAYKKALSVSQKTPNTIIYGELGRYPLYNNEVMKSVKYLLKLVEPPSNRLLQSCL